MTISTKPARGMRDFLPAEVKRRRYVIETVRRIYERYGFEPLETPAAENIGTLAGKYGEEGDKLIFKILKRGDGEMTGQADLALRYDLTVPLARVVAEYRSKLPKFFKRYQIQPVWRADRPQKGRYREFYQCDVDVVGSVSPTVEVELCSAVSEVLLELGFDNFEIEINHRELLASWLANCGVESERQSSALVALDKFDKIGLEGVADELAQRGFDASTINRLRNWLQASWQLHWVDWIVQQFDRLDSAGRAAAEDVRRIMELVEHTSARGRLKFKPSLARGLSYYTGPIFELRVPELAGSLGGGGRYDRLIGMFGSTPVPAAGFSLGLERILVVMDERGMFPADLQTGPADILVTLWSEDAERASVATASALRKEGLRVELYARYENPGRQFAYAESRGIRYVAVVGKLGGDADEVLSQALVGFDVNTEILLKDLKTGQQERIRVPEITARVRSGSGF